MSGSGSLLNIGNTLQHHSVPFYNNVSIISLDWLIINFYFLPYNVDQNEFFDQRKIKIPLEFLFLFVIRPKQLHFVHRHNCTVKKMNQQYFFSDISDQGMILKVFYDRCLFSQRYLFLKVHSAFFVIFDNCNCLILEHFQLIIVQYMLWIVVSKFGSWINWIFLISIGNMS